MRQEDLTSDDVKKMFRCFDSGDSGYISRQALADVLLKYEVKPTMINEILRTSTGGDERQVCPSPASLPGIYACRPKPMKGAICFRIQVVTCSNLGV